MVEEEENLAGVSGATMGFVVHREFCQNSVAFKSVFAKMKMNTDIKIVILSEDSIREGHSKKQG